MTKDIKGLTKYVQDEDARIVKLTDRVEGMMDEESIHVPRKVYKYKRLSITLQSMWNNKDIQVSSDETISIKQIKDFIKGTIKEKYEVATKSSLTYASPYTTRIDSFKIPTGYPLQKFQQFDGKGSLKQHMAHLIEMCNNAGTYGDYLVK